MTDRSTVPLLTRDLLSRLEAAWTAQCAPIVDHLAPGLSDAEMDEITAPFGIRLPMEAREWWGWHDGVPSRPDDQPTPERFIGPSLQYKPLRDAARDYAMERKIFAGTGEDVDLRVEMARPAAYFHITHSTGPIMCDCGVPQGAPSPIYYTHTHGNPEEELQQPCAGSFGEMVSWWIDALNDGTWRWDAHKGRWHYDWERVPLERSGLV